ncbi:MAG TPA: glycosyltransferase family 39 protein [Flavipsychrobacter sp.]
MNLKNLTSITIVILLAVIPLFGHLDELPIQRWDESRLAVTAYEMSINNNWLVPYHFGHPEMIGVKPPLQIWFMAMSIKLFGANELAVRLPSAIFALLTCLFIYWFLTVKMQKRVWGVLAAAILVICDGYVHLHCSRTGDYDTLLTLLTTIFLFYSYLFIRDSEAKYIVIAAIAITLACFTKGVAALMFIPGVFICFAYSGKLKKLFSSPAFYAGLAIFIIVIPGYYLLREQLTPGYLESVSRNELGGRFLSTLENHYQPWYFYIFRLIEREYAWFFISIMAVPLVLIYKENAKRQFVLFLATTAVSFLFFISVAGTKLDWYSMPLYPLLAVMAAITIETVFSKLKPGANYPLQALRIAVLLFICTLYVYSYNKILAKTLKPDYQLNDPEFAIGHYLTGLHKGNRGTGKFVILYSDYEQDMVWYDLIDSSIFFKSVKELATGDTVVAYKHESIAVLENKYHHTLLEDYFRIRLYRIDSLKATTTPQ